MAGNQEVRTIGFYQNICHSSKFFSSHYFSVVLRIKKKKIEISDTAEFEANGVSSEFNK